ncbi:MULTISPECIES: hypothetical protein [unclassified Nostoc]|uniref:hypothetical protein n=1 Tax=unclassified Nostoc TaxID=2593658 RepID=UPI0015E32455|nr:hypothetical protein [Nostoc sp. 'Peltigera membranacea cyanobiont' N6]
MAKAVHSGIKKNKGILLTSELKVVLLVKQIEVIYGIVVNSTSNKVLATTVYRNKYYRKSRLRKVGYYTNWNNSSYR